MPIWEKSSEDATRRACAGEFAGHPFVEQVGFLRICREEFEETRSVGMFERSLPGAYRMQQVTPRSPVHLIEQEQHGRAR
jgi:hypothetical protein